MSTSGTSSIFSGTSRYSADFRQIVDRSVAIASLPLTQMQSQRTALSDESAALASLESKVASLTSAVRSLDSAATAYSTLVSEGTVLSASVTSGALAGVYDIEVVDIGSYSTAMSGDDHPVVASPSLESISLSSEFTMTVDGVEFEITTGENTLMSLAEAINASEAEVEATVVNLGSGDAPDYRLSLRSTKLGEVAIQLNDGSQDLVDSVTAGSLASYRVNGQPSEPIESDSRTVTLAPGLTITLLKGGSSSITVSHSLTAVSSALAGIASAYNQVVDELDEHRGEEAGVLRGNSTLYSLAEFMRQLANYSTWEGEVSSLGALGLTFDDQGKLSLDMTEFSAATAGGFEALAEFLGGTSTSGFLKHATDLMDGLEDSTDGLLTTAIQALQEQIGEQDTRIAAEQERIDELEQNLLTRMAASDALIAALEQQVKFMNGLFEAMQESRRNW